jgi:hypothetical protein
VTVIPDTVDISALGIYNVKSSPFSAAGDGVTDDTAAIQAAINAAYTAGGGIVYLPSARYLIDGGSITPPTNPGGIHGTYNGTTPVPKDKHGNTYVLTGMSGANDGVGGTMLPNGALLLFDNVTLLGDGPEQSILLAGPHIYGGYMLSPDGDTQCGIVVASVNYWAEYASDLADFQDGFFAHNVYVRNLSIDCQGDQGVIAGWPLNVVNPVGFAFVPNPASCASQPPMVASDAMATASRARKSPSRA